MSNPLQALCCICGTLRTCQRPRNYRPENYWLAGPIDRDWHRETGDLKCEECGRITTHALIRPPGDAFRDHAEMMTRVATGTSHTHFTTAEKLTEVRRKYNEGQPHNPFLHHYWWNSDPETTLCGRKIASYRDPSPEKPSDDDDSHHLVQLSGSHQTKPRFRDHEYEDETGLSWREMDCVDCLRVWHLELLRQRRKVLSDVLIRFTTDLAEDMSGYPKRFDLAAVNGLIDAIENAYSANVTKVKDATR